MSENPCCVKSPFLPLCLFGLSLVLFFGWQYSEQSQRGKALSQTIESRRDSTQKAEQVATIFSRLATDVIALAKEDEGAEVVVRRHGISLATPGTDPAAAPTTPAP